MDKPGELKEISSKEGEITKTISVKKIENGFLVCERTSGFKNEKDAKEWKNRIEEEKMYFSETNPLVIEEAIKGEKDKDEDGDTVSIAALKAFINSDIGSLINTKGK